MAKHWKSIVLTVAAASTAALLFAALIWFPGDGTQTLAKARDSAGIEVVVTQRPTFIKVNSELTIVANGTTFNTGIDDDMDFGQLDIILDDPWVLVANDGHVVAAYNKLDHRILGEYDWSEFPYLSSAGRGKVLQSRRISAHGSLPANYPLQAPASSAVIR